MLDLLDHLLCFCKDAGRTRDAAADFQFRAKLKWKCALSSIRRAFQDRPLHDSSQSLIPVALLLGKVWANRFGSAGREGWWKLPDRKSPPEEKLHFAFCFYLCIHAENKSKLDLSSMIWRIYFTHSPERDRGDCQVNCIFVFWIFLPVSAPSSLIYRIIRGHLIPH